MEERLPEITVQIPSKQGRSGKAEKGTPAASMTLQTECLHHA
jgi:hypothetical protein